jgi:hypothetical protein
LWSSRARETVIIGEHSLCALHLTEGRRIGIARGVKKYTPVGIEQSERLDLIGFRAHDNTFARDKAAHHILGQHAGSGPVVRVDRCCRTGYPVLADLDDS